MVRTVWTIQTVRTVWTLWTVRTVRTVRTIRTFLTVRTVRTIRLFEPVSNKFEQVRMLVFRIADEQLKISWIRAHPYCGLRVCSFWLRPFPLGALQEELRNIKKQWSVSYKRVGRLTWFKSQSIDRYRIIQGVPKRLCTT